MISAPPILSIIVIAFKMPSQAYNTLYSLSSQHQILADERDYEIIVVENQSPEMLCPEKIGKLGENIQYFSREEKGVSPVSSINFAFDHCRGKNIALLIDGARMVTPGLVNNILSVYRANERSVIGVPGYQLGDIHHNQLEDPVESLTHETALLKSIAWPSDGYELFNIACLSNANRFGYLHPLMESNCIVAPYNFYRQIGFADSRFTLPGGGAVNLHLWRSLGLIENSQLYILPGEGNFHQYHGGVTTSESYFEGNLKSEIKSQLDAIWNEDFHALRREPILFGKISSAALPYLKYSSECALNRNTRLEGNQELLWFDDLNLKAS